MANLIGVLFFTLFSSLSFAESHCLQRKNEPTRLLRVGLGESHTKVLPLDVQGVMASVSVEDHYPELKSAMESGEVDVVAAVFPQGQVPLW